MTEADLARRIHANMKWSLIVDAGRPLAECPSRMDVWNELQLLWKEPDSKFVEALYLLLLSRPADPVGLAAHGNALAAGLSRTELVRTIATSTEAKTGDLDVSWLSRLEASRPPRRSLLSLTTLKSLVGRAMRRVRKLGAAAKGPGKGES